MLKHAKPISDNKHNCLSFYISFDQNKEEKNEIFMKYYQFDIVEKGIM